MVSDIKHVYSRYFFHLPYYMLTTNEAFVLHSFVIVFITFISYGLYSLLSYYI
ncbi:Hypothetical protein PP7435_CHR3-1545 [Komagataella phaffii CBS 7435]|uniref:Uncharacterized protein n=1 Tax=Komagataella phaffii (strain ATCC 76273 / CBS 7435 / CECT 11047 / NRRL Y-11430 / Wegner 21-1) TaxID=981350 RepID=A0A1G4KQ81_KOMPC|nr:Hypothetical protein BQ9382_C3-1298 [Komagataella phaffii CBS 7435]SCV12169.1 Hypothetical protein PP7435_CHR3-1545 [Komagataella phaffii CBS 7435]